MVVVIAAVLVALALFLVALVPVIADQVTAMVDRAPGWVEALQSNALIQRLDERYDLLQKAQEFVTSGDFTQRLFGGAVGVGVAVLSALANAFIVIVLTLYFLASLPRVKSAAYRLAPASRRSKVTSIGDRMVHNIGAYVSGAFVVAFFAGFSSLIFLFIVGLAEYAVALAVVVALLDVIPMIGATLGAVIVTLIGLATDPTIGLACVVFYVIYQQVENYVIYPRVMARSVDIPGSLIVIAALIGAGLLGVVGALLAIPTAAALLLVFREVVVPAPRRPLSRVRPGRVLEGRGRPVGVDEVSAVSMGPSHSRGSGTATSGATRWTISSRTVSASPTHRCLAPSTPTTSACGTTENRSRASSGCR